MKLPVLPHQKAAQRNVEWQNETYGFKYKYSPQKAADSELVNSAEYPTNSLAPKLTSEINMKMKQNRGKINRKMDKQEARNDVKLARLPDREGKLDVWEDIKLKKKK